MKRNKQTLKKKEFARLNEERARQNEFTTNQIKSKNFCWQNNNRFIL